MEAAAGEAHVFWPDDLSLLSLGVLDWSRVLGHRQVPDADRRARAGRHAGRFVTFDRRLALEVVPGARAEHLVVLE